MKSLAKIFTSIFLGIFICACSPRGESSSLDEVLATQRSKFDNASKAAPVQTTELLQPLVSQLEKVDKNSATSLNLDEVANSLSLVIDKASYTSRPAMSELVSQYRALSSQKSVESNAVRLLVARTYSILSSELETTKFSL